MENKHVQCINLHVLMRDTGVQRVWLLCWERQGKWLWVLLGAAPQTACQAGPPHHCSPCFPGSCRTRTLRSCSALGGRGAGAWMSTIGLTQALYPALCVPTEGWQGDVSGCGRPVQKTSLQMHSPEFSFQVTVRGPQRVPALPVGSEALRHLFCLWRIWCPCPFHGPDTTAVLLCFGALHSYTAGVV